MSVAVLCGYAQEGKVNIQGNVQDAFLERGLYDCIVTLMHADSTVVECSPQVFEIGNDPMHITTIYEIDVSRETISCVYKKRDMRTDGQR